MAIVTYSCTKCKPIDKSILEVYIALKDLDNTASANEDERVAAEEARAEAETARAEEFALLHEQAGGDHSVAEGDHTRAEADHATASADHENAVADRNGYNADHTAAVADHAVAASDHVRAGQDHARAENDHTRTLGYGEISERDHARAEADHEAIFGDHSIFVDDHNQYLADHATAEEDHTASVAATAAANAAGITSASASVDSNVGTPSVDVSLVNKQLSLSFHNIKGEKGEKGDRGDGVIPVVNDLVTGGTDAALSAEMGKTLNTTKQATLVSGTNIKTVNGESLLGDGNIIAGDPNAVKYVEQTLTDAQKAQARTNIGAYQKPSGGIPKADLDTGVQGSLDLADTAIQAQPVGSITPPADPSEWATAEEVAQLEAEVTDKDIYDSYLFEKQGRIVAATGEIIFSNSSGYPIRVYAVEEGLPLKFDIYSFSSSYLAYVFYDGDGFKQANVIDSGSGTGWGNRIVKNINAPTGAKYLAFLLRDGYTSSNKFTIGVGNKDYTKLYLERAAALKEPYRKFISDNIVEPVEKYNKYVLNSNGNIESTNSTAYTLIYDIVGANSLYIKNLAGATNQVIFAFYSAKVVNSTNLLEKHTQATTGDDIDGIYQVPSGAKRLAITYSTNVPFVCSDVHIPKEDEYMDELTDENYLLTITGKYVNASTGAASTSVATNIQVYRVEPGQFVYLKSDNINLIGFEFIGLYKAVPIGQDNFVSVLTDRPSSVNSSFINNVEYFFKIPDGANILAATVKADGTSIVKILGENDRYSIFSLNPQEAYKPLLMNSKYRHGNEYFYTGEYDNLTLLYFADIHAQTDNAKRLMAFYGVYKGMYKNNAYKTLIDDVLCGGDIVGSYLNLPADSMDSDGSLIWWKDCGLSKVLPTIGNHDAWALENNVRVDVDEETCYRTFIAPYVSGLNIVQPTGAGTNGYYPCYYYKDYVEPTYGSATPTWNTTIRLIVLDCMHWTTEQKNWLVAVLADCKTNNKSVIICSHYSPRLNYNYESTFCNLTPFADTFLNAEVPALVDESDVDFICYLSGHTHDDQFGTVVDYPNQSAIVIDCASCRQNEHTNRWENTKSQDCFNIVSFDTKQGLVKIVRIGSDVDSYLRSKKVMTYNYRTGEIVCNY